MRERSTMGSDDVKRIDVQGKPVGIVGLADAVEEVARNYPRSPQKVVEEALLEKLSVKNYIPDRARQEYGRAFFREYSRFMGRPCEEEGAEGMRIEVLGPGCHQCGLLERNVIDAVAEMGLPASVDHVTDVKTIGAYGVMGTPALVVNGQVRSVGRVVSKAEIRKLLETLPDRDHIPD